MVVIELLQRSLVTSLMRQYENNDEAGKKLNEKGDSVKEIYRRENKEREIGERQRYKRVRYRKGERMIARGRGREGERERERERGRKREKRERERERERERAGDRREG